MDNTKFSKTSPTPDPIEGSQVSDDIEWSGPSEFGFRRVDFPESTEPALCADMQTRGERFHEVMESLKPVRIQSTSEDSGPDDLRCCCRPMFSAERDAPHLLKQESLLENELDNAPSEGTKSPTD